MKESLSQVSASESGRKFSDSPAFALISTLLIIAVLTIMVIAFMQSMRVDRLSARSYLDKYRADLAAKSAVNRAVAQLRNAVNDTNTGKGDFSYTTEMLTDTNTNKAYSPVLTISRYAAVGSNFVRTVVPLVSGTNATLFTVTDTNTVNLVNPTNTATLAARSSLSSDRRIASTGDLNWNMEIQGTNTYGTNTDSTNFYRVSYLPLTNSAGKVGERYAYIVTDEQAKLNPQFHKAAARDNYSTNASEMPLSLGDNTLFTTAEQTAFLANTSTPASAATAMRFFSTTQRAQDRRQFFGSYDTVNQDVIPGIYPDAGKPKYNIRELATNTNYGATDILRAENIATIIDRNLPDFKMRDPSFAMGGSTNNIKYVRRLAANIVDYVDTDTTSTFANNGEPAGKDLFPMVTGVAHNFRWISKGSSPSYINIFSTQCYVEIWNPYTYPVTGTPRFELLGRMTLKVGSAPERNLKDYNQTSLLPITIQPNQFYVVEFPEVNEDPYVSTLVDPDSPTTGRPLWEATSSSDLTKQPHPYFKFYWNNQLVDMNRRMGEAPATSGLTMSLVAQSNGNANRIQVGQNRWAAHFPQTPDTGDGKRRVVDPRINSLSNYDWLETINSTYTTNTRWGGRVTSTLATGMDLVTALAARDYVRANPNLGVNPSSTSKTPRDAFLASPYSLAADGPNAPFYISTNSIQSIGELGHVFDPVQASDNGVASPALDSMGKGVGPFGSGGGRSLRIGQPEFSTNSASTWDVKGKRAMELLDLFTVNSAPTTSINSYPEFKGRININTAPSEVLQAMFYNIKIKSDPGFGITSGMDEAKSKILADAIVADRTTNGSYSKLSDFYRVLNLKDVSNVPIWNKADAYTPPLGSGTGTNPPEVMDRAREELFAKMVNLVDTQSRAYRIYATGQALGPTGKVMARSYIETLVILEQGTNATGDPILIPRIVYEKFY